MSPSHHPEFKFARCISSPTCAADRSGGGVPSLRQTTLNNRKHTTTRRRAGAGRNRVMGLTRCDASLPVYGQGRDHVVAVWNGRGFSLTALFPDTQTTNCGRCFGIGRLFEQYGIGRPGKAALIAIIHNAADHSGNDAVEPLKSHFKVSVRYALKASHGASHCAEQISQGRGNV